jgi:glycerophosphoryl diester phosphodiesterase
MTIIGHRGAAGLALENTVESIQAAIAAGVDAVEFDVRATADQQLVLVHDKHTGRISNKTLHIHQHTLARLRKMPLLNGHPPSTLTEALQAARHVPVLIEGKEANWAEPLAAFLKKQPKDLNCKVISFNLQELYRFKLLMPDIKTYALEHTKPIGVIQSAQLLGLDGVDINFWLLNPLTYILARRCKLDIIVYTVNSPFLARFLRLFYPRISITSDVPDRLQFLRARTKTA